MRSLSKLRLAIAAVSAMAVGVCAQELLVQHQGDLVKISAPKLHFLTGSPLERIRNGRAVPYDFQLTVFSDPKGAPVSRTLERFVFSYDLWEEKFQVKRLRTGDASRRLSADAAERWCVDQMSFNSGALPRGNPVWVRLEVRAQEPKDAMALNDDGGVSLTTLIELFSRASKAREQNYWRVESGPLNLSVLRLKGSNGD
jgi:hypothetical protein